MQLREIQDSHAQIQAAHDSEKHQREEVERQLEGYKRAEATFAENVMHMCTYACVHRRLFLFGIESL
jgi:hypothetical protein